LRLVQFIDRAGIRRVAAAENDSTLRMLNGVTRTYDLAFAAVRANTSLAAIAAAKIGTETVSYDELISDKRLLPPLDHVDPYRCLISGTGLSHLGSAAARDAMHAKIQQDEAQLTDSMKMFKWGLDGGKPASGKIGVQPEWAYKGDGSWLVAPEQPLELPGYAEDGGEEGEIAGLYVIGDGGEVLRVGFALGNEYSDHVMERRNYLYLAHSKLRQSSFGPELVLGALPSEVKGAVRITRGGKEAWKGELISGESNMCHSIANLEQHHFKYPGFRRPGDVHIYYYGASALSTASGFKAEPGDVFEVEAAPFGRPLRNPLRRGASDATISVHQL